MTLTNIIDRFKGSFAKANADQPDMFDTRLQKLTSIRAREVKNTQSVFKTRHQRLEA